MELELFRVRSIELPIFSPAMADNGYLKKRIKPESIYNYSFPECFYNLQQFVAQVLLCVK